MAYAQWIYMLIQNLMRSGNLTVKNLEKPWGKFYQWDNKDTEISADKVCEQVAGPKGQIAIASCGRSDASSGTEGKFDIYDGDVKVCHIYWSCPWGSKQNTFTVSQNSDDYLVQATGMNNDSGASGNVTIKVAKLG